VQPSRHVEERVLFPDKIGINQRSQLDRVMAAHAKSNNTDGSFHVRATGVSRSADPAGNHTDNRVGSARRECQIAREAAHDARDMREEPVEMPVQRGWRRGNPFASHIGHAPIVSDSKPASLACASAASRIAARVCSPLLMP